MAKRSRTARAKTRSELELEIKSLKSVVRCADNERRRVWDNNDKLRGLLERAITSLPKDEKAVAWMLVYTLHNCPYVPESLQTAFANALEYAHVTPPSDDGYVHTLPVQQEIFRAFESIQTDLTVLRAAADRADELRKALRGSLREREEALAAAAHAWGVTGNDALERLNVELVSRGLAPVPGTADGSGLFERLSRAGTKSPNGAASADSAAPDST